MRKWQRDLAATIKRDTEDFRTVIKHLPGMQQFMKINILEYIQARIAHQNIVPVCVFKYTL